MIIIAAATQILTWSVPNVKDTYSTGCSSANFSASFCKLVDFAATSSLLAVTFVKLLAVSDLLTPSFAEFIFLSETKLLSNVKQSINHYGSYMMVFNQLPVSVLFQKEVT